MIDLLPFVTTRLPGLGMGLSICRRIVEAHGGRIWIGKDPNGWSVTLEPYLWGDGHLW